MEKLIFYLFLLITNTLYSQDSCKFKQEVDKFTGIKTFKSSLSFLSDDKNLAIDFTVEPSEKRILIGLKLSDKKEVVCIQQISIIKLLFEDGEVINFVQLLSFNCDGHAAVTLSPKNKPEKKILDKIKTKKLKAIRIPTYKELFDYDFSDEEGVLLKKYILCAAENID